jgi:bis(5'-nucleosyl)-tetraphosphatase (symmetrical)
MATYAIGDIHGCFDELQLLLKKIAFNATTDIVWFTGDLVNGGDKSVETMQFVKGLGKSAVCVLGNHDLTLLGIAMGKINPDRVKDPGIKRFLHSHNSDEQLNWLQQLPLLHYDARINTLLVHAGLAPQWELSKALSLSKEVETVIHGSQAPDFFANMLGNEPAIWDDNLTGWCRLRCVTNYLTRIRFCSKDGLMDLLEKGPSKNAPPNMMPWYEVPNRQSNNVRIIFGHWAALIGKTNSDNNVIALDTGCVWGNYLSALRLEDNIKFSIKRIGS